MKKSGRILSAIAVCVLGVAVVVAGPVAPANLQLTCLRTTAVSGNVTDTTYWQGDTISFSNSVMYVGSDTNSAVQDLVGCAITVTMGSLNSTNTTVSSGSAIVASNGTWTTEMAVPEFNPCYIQVSVSNNAVFTYPLYRVSTQSKLGQ